MCGAPAQSTDLDSVIHMAGIDVSKETVIQGVVSSGEAPVAGAYVRLLDATGEFTAEVVSSATGQFRFFAAPGRWTLRALHASGSGQVGIAADRGVNEAELTLV